MGCHGNHAFRQSQNKFLAGDIFRGGGHTLGPYEQFDTHQNLPWCRKVGKIRS